MKIKRLKFGSFAAGFRAHTALGPRDSLICSIFARARQRLDRWKSATTELASEEPEARLASDLFLDGLLRAANSQFLLEQVWQDLIANHRQIFNRLLNRLVGSWLIRRIRINSRLDFAFLSLSDQLGVIWRQMRKLSKERFVTQTTIDGLAICSLSFDTRGSLTRRIGGDLQA